MQRLCIVVVLGMLAAAQVQGQLRSGLVCYWPLDAIQTDRTPDLVSGYDLFLYNLNERNIVEGRYRGAFSFNGLSQFLALNYPSKPKLPIVREQNYTIAFWVKAPRQQKDAAMFAEGFTLSDQPLFEIGSHPAGDSQAASVYLCSSEAVQLDNVTAEMPIFDDNWHHVAWVDQNGHAQLYIDGRLDVASFVYERRPVRLNDLSIGALFRDTPTAFFRGVIDDVALWQRALSKEEIAQVMNGELNLLFAGKPGT